jgi:hypothetical protein
MDRYTILTLVGSALLSAFAFVAVNNKPSSERINVEYIEFKVGCVYIPTNNTEERLVCPDSSNK